jgi:uncharacterized protein
MQKNAISWFEIPVKDFVRAKKFYENTLGVNIHEETMGPVKMGFIPADNENGGVGGAICQSEDYIPSSQGSLVYLNGGNDLSMVLNNVEKAGGRILVPKTEIAPGMGFFALFLDTEGNKLGLHSRN